MRHFAGRTVDAARAGGKRPARWQITGGCQRRFGQAKRLHVRQCQRSLAQIRSVSQARRTLLRDVAECIGSQVAIGFRIRRAADTKGIKNKQESACHQEISN
jgi:hypothetical protein